MQDRWHVIDFVVVSYNTLDLLRDLYAAMQKQFRDPHLVIVDNNSTDGTQDWLKRIKKAVVILRDVNDGYSKAANLGAEYGDSEYIVFMNPDIILSAEAIYGALNAMIDDKVVIASPQELKANGEPRMYDGFAGGACMAVKRWWFDKNGGFDERLEFGCDDIDISRRAVEQGYRWKTTGIPIVHLGQRSHDAMAKKKVDKAKEVLDENWETVVLKYKGPGYLIGIPARDLTRADLVNFADFGKERLLKSGIYMEVE